MVRIQAVASTGKNVNEVKLRRVVKKGKVVVETASASKRRSQLQMAAVVAAALVLFLALVRNALHLSIRTRLFC